ncbi:YqjK-like family protein [Moellerella wisconsensis]|uniref:YqjK-like family protein n=2 Tax=Moellerella wisconsensis TaxID=158849 RepID=A0A9Q8Q3A9_9GAMM|nr:YqjK-like family protein [Moellerella wisconsensis]KLN97725.1 hypothetical protein VK86_03475 [Moellerella wisconsensis]UNH24614.1 YqjK-like family protein [Moellerella wisconsensis]UNH27719.1 YqjK-like family protein [Moellerella wisconsensis]UNH31216.1 YqjK-like family protein [Moellerella wisconsensis]UNH39339.1 YqjK-like family protein [Moellerella wisconsensis]
MANKQKILAEKKRQLLQQIEQQRTSLSDTTQHWLKITEPYDRTWQTLISFRPILIAGASLLSLYSLRRPKKLLSWGKRALGAWGIVRTVRNSVSTHRS